MISCKNFEPRASHAIYIDIEREEKKKNRKERGGERETERGGLNSHNGGEKAVPKPMQHQILASTNLGFNSFPLSHAFSLPSIL